MEGQTREGLHLLKDEQNKEVRNHLTKSNQALFLPPGWESAHDSNGKIYYIDHNSKTTTYKHPLGQDLERDRPVGYEEKEKISKKKKLIGSINVFFMLSSIFLIYYVNAFEIALPMINSTTDHTRGIIYITFIHFIFLLVISSYFSAFLSNPGYVDSEVYKYPPDNFCAKCNRPKPERAHHCSKCNRCVLRMDHHCPWINNCVGWRNHKSFILLVSYATIGGIFCTVISIIHLVQEKNLSSSNEIAILSSTIVSGMESLSVISLTYFNWTMLFQNNTTLEKMTFKNPKKYNFGIKHNFLQLFGTNPFLWFVPINTSQGSGYEFPKKEISQV